MFDDLTAIPMVFPRPTHTPSTSTHWDATSFASTVTDTFDNLLESLANTMALILLSVSTFILLLVSFDGAEELNNTAYSLDTLTLFTVTLSSNICASPIIEIEALFKTAFTPTTVNLPVLNVKFLLLNASIRFTLLPDWNLSAISTPFASKNCVYVSSVMLYVSTLGKLSTTTLFSFTLIEKSPSPLLAYNVLFTIVLLVAALVP